MSVNPHRHNYTHGIASPLRTTSDLFAEADRIVEETTRIYLIVNDLSGQMPLGSERNGLTALLAPFPHLSRRLQMAVQLRTTRYTPRDHIMYKVESVLDGLQLVTAEVGKLVNVCLQYCAKFNIDVVAPTDNCSIPGVSVLESDIREILDASREGDATNASVEASLTSWVTRTLAIVADMPNKRKNTYTSTYNTAMQHAPPRAAQTGIQFKSAEKKVQAGFLFKLRSK